mmetsp:Transcript_3416/g.6291  ORF Transcript_3416/g.6291 Transcript_3416/m.6291 type:complete len:407 (+) Transcript_3416:240-1460(+)
MKHESQNQHRVLLSKESYGLLLLLLSAVLYSVAGVLVKLAANKGLSSSELVLLRAIFQATIVVTCMCLYKTDNGVRLIRQPFGNDARVIKIVIVRGIVGGLGFCLYFYTISVLPLGDATALISLKPVPAIFLGRIWLGEPITPLHVVVTITSVVGSILIAQPSFLFASQHASASIGHVTGLLGACCAAGVVTLIRKAGSIGAHTLQLLFSWAFFGILFSTISLVYTSFQLPSSTTSWIYVVGMSVIGSMAHFLLNYAGQLAPASLSSVVRSSDLMFAYIWEIFIFSTIPNGWTWMGVGFISLSLIMITVQKIKEHQNKQQQQQQQQQQSCIKRKFSSDMMLQSDNEEEDDDTVMTAMDDCDTLLKDEHKLELQQRVDVENLKSQATVRTSNGDRYFQVAKSDDPLS